LTASLGEPLLYREELIGAITLSHEAGRCFSEEDQELVRLFATQAAIAIENARLYDTALRRGEELQALLDASRSLMADLDLRGILERIAAAASTISGSTRIKIALHDPAAGALRVECDTGSGTPVGTLIPLEGTLSGLAIRTHQPVFSIDCAHDPRNAFAADDAARGLVTSLNLPIRYRGTVLGTLSFNTTTPRTYPPEELRYLQAFADQAAIAIENARLYQAAVRRGAELEALLRTSRSLMSGLDLQKILDRIATEAAAIAGTPSVKVLLVDKQTGQIRLGALTGATACEFPIPVGTGLSGLVASSGEPLFCADCQNDPRNVSAAADRVSGVVTYLGLPIRSRGEVVGILTFSTTAPREYPPEELAYLISFADQAAIAIENARLFEDQRQAYRELQQAKDELVRSEKLRALGQMAAGIAHDLNNMLAAILGQAELLRLRIQLPEVQEALQTLYTAATDGAQVVRRLQEFGRRQASTPLVPCDLASIVHEVLELTRPRWRDEAQRQGRSIQVQTSLDRLPRVLGHPGEIREALTNLILNAMDAMPEGGTLTLAGTADPAPPLFGKPGGVSLTVADTGVGMPEEVCRRIFEPFFTTKGPRGTGLGLAVVYGILERHGGRIDVSSTPGRGTTFTLRFQAAPRESGAADRPSISQAPVPRRLLIIDDETTVRTTIATLLRAVGHEVTEARSGPEGLASLAEHPVDLVITDLGMPGMTGWEVAQQVKAAHPQLPAILLTGWGQQAVPPAWGRDCVDRVLGKPIRLEDLQGAIAALTATGKPPHRAA
jgi:signal transduction histidine kinase/CheY-like chemotaxis protein